ncbi:MAG: hypothetical protein Q4C72_09560 [Eubacteriales bacterium]|nr:hypothetical protein [Eubacteriales bacterium]
MDRKDETMNLDALKDFLNDVPDTGEFDLDSIIAEVSGGAPAAPKAEPRPAPEPHRAAPEPRTQTPAAAPKAPAEAPKAAEPSRTAPRTPPAPKAEPEEQLPDLSAFEEEEDYDPRAERLAAREAKAAAKRQKAEAKAAARAARLAAEAEEDDEEGEQPPVRAFAPRRAVRAEKMTRKEAKAARLAAEQAEEDEDIELRDPAQAARAFKRRAQGLSARSLFVLIFAIAAVYLSIAPGFDILPVPTVLDASQNPTIAVGALMLLQFLAIFLGIDVFGMGFYNLLHGTPDRSSLVSFAVLASLLHGASIIVFENEAGVEIPYLAVSILLLYAAMREERGRFSARARSYQAFCSAERPMAVYSHYDREDDVCRAVKGPLHDERAFLMEMERPDTVDRFSLIYVPIALACSIIFALVASVGRGEPVRFFWAFSAILSVSAPLGLVCAFGAGYKNVSRRLLGLGAALAGARQSNLLRGTEEVVLSENDLFPAGSVSLEALQNMGQLPDDKLLGCAAALADAAGLELGRVLTEAVRERYGATLAVRNVQRIEGGLAGEVGTSRIVLGTAALMVKMGVRIRSGQGESVNAYLVVDNALAGVLALRYQPTKHTYQGMRLMRRMHMNALLAVQDFNISPAMVESEFDLRRGFADQPEPDVAQRLLDPSYTEGDAPAAILTREGAGPFIQVLRCADKLAGAVRSALTLGAFAGICGMLIVFYLVFQNAVDALPVLHLLLYLLIWYIPVFLIMQQTH